MTDTLESTRNAQDGMLLMGFLLAALGLVIAGPLLPVPMLGCIGLPIGLLAALIFSLMLVLMGRTEVPWWRHLFGVAVAVGGLYLFFSTYLEGLAIIAEHFLDRRGAPPLSDLVGCFPWLALAALVMSGSVAIRRKRGKGLPIGVAVVSAATAGLGWALLVLLGILGFPFGA